MAVHELGGPAAWTGEEMRSRSDWMIELEPGHVAELGAALEAVDQPGVELLDVGKDDFVLPTLAPVLEQMVDELMDGRGFALLRGVPVESLTEHQVELMTWGIGLHVGIPLQQGVGANLLMHVRDQGVDPKSPLARGYQHRALLDYHTDTPDVVALLCVRPAMEGGVSTIVSSVAVHDEIVRVRPDLAEVLYQSWWHDRRRGDDPDSFFQCPIYAVNAEGTKLFAYYGPDYIRSAPRAAHVPDLTAEQLEAMDLLEGLNNDPRFVLDMHFQPGDVQFLSNYVTMHGRTEYVDYPDPARKRDLIRLWLTIDRDLGLPDSISERGLMSRSAAFRRPSLIMKAAQGATAMLERPVTGPAVWRGEDLQDSEEWILRLGEGDFDEIEKALAAVADRPVEQLAKGEVALPGLESRLRSVSETLQDGRGFVLIRGLPVPDRFDDEQAAKIFCGIGHYLGTPVSQSRRGELIGHLRNIGQPGAFQRRFATSEATAFHNDRTDVVGLMCLRPARFGGESLLVSTMALYNIVLDEHPEFLPILYKEFAKDLMDEQGPGQPGWERLPLFCYESGYLSGTTSTSWFVSAMRFADVPRLSAEEMSCFLFLESLPKRPGLSLSMMLEPGDIQFVNNFSIMHTRTGFVDDPDDPAHQRHLLRLWLSHFEGGRPVCSQFAGGRTGLQPVG